MLGNTASIALRFCRSLTKISYGKTPSDLKRMRFQPIFGAKDDGGLAPAEDDKSESGENSPFEAGLDPSRLPLGTLRVPRVMNCCMPLPQTETPPVWAAFLSVAGAEGLEPSARGFGDRCSTN